MTMHDHRFIIAAPKQDTIPRRRLFRADHLPRRFPLTFFNLCSGQEQLSHSTDGDSVVDYA